MKRMIFLMCCLILFELIADIFAKEFSLQNKTYLGMFALICYVIANVFWLFALKNGAGLAKGAAIFSVSTALLAAGLGIFFYKEELTVLQRIGIVLGIISISLIFIDES